MKRKVVYVSFVHLTEKYSRDWNIDYLAAEGLNVEYWDIVAFTREKYTEHHAKTINFSHVLHSFAELEARLKLPENKSAVYFMMIPYAPRFVRVFRLMSRYKCRMMSIAWGSSPINSTGPSRKLLNHLQHPWTLARKIFDRGMMAALTRFNLLRPLDVVFAAGAVMVKGQRFATRTVPVNYTDYDNFMRARTGERLVRNGPYAVFLDTNLPFQADLKLAGLSALEPRNYYLSLNRFFDRVESQFGVKVVIAAHPKSNYDKDTFQGRGCFHDLTPELVRDADFVITQTSTALSYAVLNCIPVIFIYTDDMSAIYAKTLIRQLHDFSAYLNAPLVNIDALTDSGILIKAPDKGRYDCYKYDFLTTPASEHTTTREILFRELSVT